MSNLIKLSNISQRRDRTSLLVTMIILRNFSECAEPKKKCTPEKKERCKRRITRNSRTLKLLMLTIKLIKRLNWRKKCRCFRNVWRT